MRHDVICDHYGRLFELPHHLAVSGCKVDSYCFNYHFHKNQLMEGEIQAGGVTWHSYNLKYRPFPPLLSYERYLLRVLGEKRPDVLIAASDCYHVVLVARLARRLKIPFIVDLYDNYASFGMGRIPFVPMMYRRAMREAAAISCVSQPLVELVRNEILGEEVPANRVVALESTINPEQFIAVSRDAARAELNLPLGASLVGYAGALDSSRGIESLYEAFFCLKKENANLCLVLAGEADGSCVIPNHPDVIYLGRLPHETISTFYSALDVGVVCMKDSDFGRYSFPQKTYELLAMGIPLAVASVGAMKELFKDVPEALYEADDVYSLVTTIRSQLAHPKLAEIVIPSWREQALKLKQLLLSII